jgi:hypothetical protein
MSIFKALLFVTPLALSAAALSGAAPAAPAEARSTAASRCPEPMASSEAGRLDARTSGAQSAGHSAPACDRAHESRRLAAQARAREPDRSAEVIMSAPGRPAMSIRVN